MCNKDHLSLSHPPFTCSHRVPIVSDRNACRVLRQQYATFFFPSCDGVGCGDTSGGLYTLPARPSPDGGGREEVVVRTWTITSVCGNKGPLEITVQAKVRVPSRYGICPINYHTRSAASLKLPLSRSLRDIDAPG